MAYYVYILASRKDGVLYVGMTGDLAQRVYQHRGGLVSGFTRRYNVHHLVYAEAHDDVHRAIQREKTIKHWPRAWKVNLIERENPQWSDLYERILA